MSFLKKIVERLFPSKEQKEQNAIVKETINKVREERKSRLEQYAEQLTLSGGIDVEKLRGLKVGEVPTIHPTKKVLRKAQYDKIDSSEFSEEKENLGSFTTVDEETKLFDLCLLYPDIQEFTLLENELVGVYLARHEESKTIVPIEKALEAKGISKEEYDKMSAEEQKQYSNMTIEKYRQISEDKINEQLFHEDPTVESIKTFTETMQQNARKNLEERNLELQEAKAAYDKYEDPTRVPKKVQNALQIAQEKFDHAQQLDNLVHDMTDSANIANQFGLGELEQKYSKYANVPVFVLAAHNLLSVGGITTRSRFNDKTIKQIWEKIEDDKTRQFFEEFAGFTFEVEKQPDGKEILVKKDLTDEMGNPRKGLFEGLLYPLRELRGDLVRDFSAKAIFDNPDYQRSIDELNTECLTILPQEISERLLDEALGFAKDVIENGKLDKERKVINKKTAKAIIRSVESFTSNIYSVVNERVNGYYKAQYESFSISASSDLSKELEGLGKDVAKNFETLFPKYRSDKFKVKAIDLMREYANEYAIIKDNAHVMKKLQNGVRLELVTAKTDEERKEIRKQYNKDKSTLAKFNAAIVKQVETNERMRVFDYTIKQINYTSLNAATDVFEKAVKDFEKEQQNKIKETRKQLTESKNKGVIAERELIDLRLTKTTQVQELYGTYLESDIKAIVSKISKSTYNQYTLTDKELNGLVKAASKKLSSVAVYDKDGKFTTELMDDEYKRLLLSFAQTHLRKRFGDKPDIEISQAEKLVSDIVAGTQGIIKQEMENPDLVPEEQKERKELLENIKKTDEKISSKTDALNQAKEEEQRLQSDLDSQTKGYDSVVLAEKIKYQQSISTIKKFEFEKTIQFLIEERSKFQEELEVKIEIPFAERDKKVEKAFNESREEYRASLQNSIAFAEEKMSELLNVALRDYDLHVQIDKETGQPILNKDGKLEFRIIDNPYRIEGDVSEDAIELYDVSNKIRIFELSAEEVTEEDLRLISGTTLEELKSQRDEIVSKYKDLEPNDPTREKFRRDFVRVSRYESGEYIYADSREELKDEDFEVVDVMLNPTAAPDATATAETEVVTDPSAAATEVVAEATADAEHVVTPEPAATATAEVTTNPSAAATEVVEEATADDEHVATPEPAATAETTASTSTYPQEVVDFVDNLHIVTMTNEHDLESTSVERKIEILTSLGFKDEEIDKTTGELATADAKTKLVGRINGATDTATNEHIPGSHDIVEATRQRVQAMPKEQQAEFIEQAVNYNISQMGDVANLEEVRNQTRQTYTNILTPEAERRVDEEVRVEPTEQDNFGDVELDNNLRISGLNQKPKKIEYTAKGCELALKSINKLIKKLEEQIKAEKEAQKEAEIKNKTKQDVLKKGYLLMVRKTYLAQHPRNNENFPPDLGDREETVDPSYDPATISDPQEELDRDAIVVKYLGGAIKGEKTEDGKSYEDILYECTGNEPDKETSKKRNKVLHKTLHNLATKEMVEEQSAKLGAYLESLEIEITSQNINALMKGTLTVKRDGVDVAVTLPEEIQSTIQTTLQANVPTREAGAVAGDGRAHE